MPLSIRSTRSAGEDCEWPGVPARVCPANSSDVHIYYYHGNEAQTAYARALWERIRRECETL